MSHVLGRNDDLKHLPVVEYFSRQCPIAVSNLFSFDISLVQ
jgi:hypothetical protein